MTPDLADGIKWYLVFLFSTSCHEAAHAWAAHKLGDDTAYHGGQVTLDPTPHIRREPFGMVVVPLLSYFMGGWMIGWASAPYDPAWALRYPRRSGLMAMAGPAANVAILLSAAVLMRVGVEWGVFREALHGGFMSVIRATEGPDGVWVFCSKMLSLLFSLNLLLAAFNLLPVPPLDGSSLPLLFLPETWAEKYQLALRNPIFSWIGIIVAWKCFGSVFPPILDVALRVLYFAMPHN